MTIETDLLLKRAEARRLLEENWQHRKQVWQTLGETRRIQSMPSSLQDRASEPSEIMVPPARENEP
jgi:hypothetical protein